MTTPTTSPPKHPPLVLTQPQYRQIETDGATAYPNECCGIMFGHDQLEARIAKRRIVRRLVAASNDFEEHEKFHRFSISAKTLMQAEEEASKTGELVLGFYHSHPDHPARPSEYDREHAWPFYSYVIVAIEKQQPRLMTSWLLNESTEQFEEQAIEVG
jgi:proteasome lid subunit RPN8/RPN11